MSWVWFQGQGQPRPNGVPVWPSGPLTPRRPPLPTVLHHLTGAACLWDSVSTTGADALLTHSCPGTERGWERPQGNKGMTQRLEEPPHTSKYSVLAFLAPFSIQRGQQVRGGGECTVPVHSTQRGPVPCLAQSGHPGSDRHRQARGRTVGQVKLEYGCKGSEGEGRPLAHTSHPWGQDRHGQKLGTVYRATSRSRTGAGAAGVGSSTQTPVGLQTDTVSWKDRGTGLGGQGHGERAKLPLTS